LDSTLMPPLSRHRHFRRQPNPTPEQLKAGALERLAALLARYDSGAIPPGVAAVVRRLRRAAGLTEFEE
jgi:hypothetical protein